jgi:hypothetical protein
VTAAVTPADRLASARSDLSGAAVDVIARALLGQLDSVKSHGRDAELQLAAAKLALSLDPATLIASMPDVALRAHADRVLAELDRRARLAALPPP